MYEVRVIYSSIDGYEWFVYRNLPGGRRELVDAGTGYGYEDAHYRGTSILNELTAQSNQE